MLKYSFYMNVLQNNEKENIMTRKDKVEILFSIISEKANEQEVKDKKIKKLSDKFLLLEKELKMLVPRNKMLNVIKFSDQSTILSSEITELKLKFAIEFMLDFFSIQ